MGGLFEGSIGMWLRRVILAGVFMVVVFLAVETVASVKAWHYIGAGINATNTISVNGHGEAYGVPDIATFTFSVVSEKSTVAAAQQDATTKINAITEYLTAAGIDKKDIQTSDYSVNPQYDYQNAVCPASAPGGATIYCPGGKQVLRGYQVRQTTTVKVRETAKAGDLLAGVGGKGATEVSSLNFTFDKPDMVQNEAREKAIANAKSKADTLAAQLGVTLVRVVSYNESGNYPVPYYSKSLMAADGRGGAEAATAPEISVGQNKVTSDVSVSYEIR
jgi:uncharacterized protein YggE